MHRTKFARDGPRLRPLSVQSRERLVKLQHDLVDDLFRCAFEDVHVVFSFDRSGRRRGDGCLAPNKTEMVDGLGWCEVKDKFNLTLTQDPQL